jgi:hypothetical protein
MSFTKFYIANRTAPATKPIDLTGPESIALATLVLKRRKKKLTAQAAQATTEATTAATTKAVDVAEEAALKAKDKAPKKPKKGPKKPQIK